MAEPYTGRLSYDGDTDFHLAEDGRPVVTEDGGRTWRYAEDGDESHYQRYHSGDLHSIKSTATVEGELIYEHGHDRAQEILREEHPHHFEVQPDDPHFARVRFDRDASKKTGHTEAWS